MMNMKGKYIKTNVRIATVSTERFFLTGVEEALQLIIDDTDNTIRGTTLVLRLNNYMFVFCECRERNNALTIEKKSTRMEIMM